MRSQPGAGEMIDGTAQAINNQQRSVARVHEILFVLNLEKVARAFDRERRKRRFHLCRAFATSQIGNCLVENILSILSAAAARRSVKRVDGFAVVSSDDAASLVYRAGRQRSFARQSAIDLRARGGQEIKSLGRELSAILQRISARSDRLCFQSLQRRK